PAVAGLVSPASPDPGTDSDNRIDQCAICATMALANALIDSTPPALPVPLIAAALQLPPAAVALEAGAASLGFQSRAPPSA
ncbi:hypothetical protein NL529_28855, partial [Klebsiella pneumoniae]|nr:hypothetical protein [Klebsiella pneumoniae]